MIKVGSTVIDHMGNEGIVKKIETRNKKMMVLIELAEFEDTFTTMNASAVQLKKAEYPRNINDNLTIGETCNTNKAWIIISSVKRAVAMAFEKKNGFVTIVCQHCEFSRKLLGFSTSSENETV